MHPDMVTDLQRDREARVKYTSCFCTPQSTYSTEHLSLIDNAFLYSIIYFFLQHTHRIRDHREAIGGTTKGEKIRCRRGTEEQHLNLTVGIVIKQYLSTHTATQD